MPSPAITHIFSSWTTEVWDCLASHWASDVASVQFTPLAEDQTSLLYGGEEPSLPPITQILPL